MQRSKSTLAKMRLVAITIAILGLHAGTVMAGGPAVSVPEPSSLMMISAGLAGLVIGGRFWWRK